MKVRFPGSDIRLIPGRGGVFDVACNGKRIYSKLNIEGQRFPHDGEITRLIEQEIG